MALPQLTIHDWPGSAGDLPADMGLLVIAVQTPPGMPRSDARQQIRQALRETLAAQLACPPAAIELFSQPGQAIRLLGRQRDIGLSVSHETGMSVAAIHMNGPVGIDLMAVSCLPDAAEMHALATDYLGCRAATLIARLPAEQRGLAFARAWTDFEARLKCLGEALAEWCPAREQRLAARTCRPLHTADGYVGMVAF